LEEHSQPKTNDGNRKKGKLIERKWKKKKEEEAQAPLNIPS